MHISSAKFVKSIVEDDPLLGDGIPQVAFIGRSNAGKSSLINSLVNQKGLARTSSFPGFTQELNVFLINKSIYFIDLPGYGFARVSAGGKEKIQDLIYSYLFNSTYEQRMVVLILDANVGPTDTDLEVLRALEEHKKNIVIVANKIDKLKKNEVNKQLKKIESLTGAHLIIPYSSKTKVGIRELTKAIS